MFVMSCFDLIFTFVSGTKHESPPSSTACDISPPADFGFCSQIAIFECLDYKAMKARKADDLNKRLGADPPIRPYRKVSNINPVVAVVDSPGGLIVQSPREMAMFRSMVVSEW